MPIGFDIFEHDLAARLAICCDETLGLVTGESRLHSIHERASPCTATVVLDPPVHAQHVQCVHGIIGNPLLDFVAKADVAIELIPGLARPYEIQHLLMQVDHVGTQCHFVSLRSWGIVPDIEVLQDVPEELQARATARSEASLRGHLNADGQEETGSQSYIPPLAKDDKALNLALGLLRGTSTNAAYPPARETAN